MKRFILLMACVALLLPLGACQTKQDSVQANPSSRVQKKQQSEMKQVLEECTTRIAVQMLKSPAFTRSKETPQVLIGKITNTTGDDTLDIHIFERSMNNVLAKSKEIKLLSHDSPVFDYITHVAIHYEDNKNTASQNSQKFGKDYIVRVQLLNYYGVLIGQWSAKTSAF